MSDLLKKLTILKDTAISIYTDIDFRKLYLSKKITLINGQVGYSNKLTDEYLSEKREVYTGRPDKTYVNNWQTYQGLVNAVLKYTGDGCLLFIRVDDGNVFDGSFMDMRWKGTFNLDISKIHLFYNDIDQMFDHRIDCLFQEKEELRIQKEKNEIRRMLLA